VARGKPVDASPAAPVPIPGASENNAPAAARRGGVNLSWAVELYEIDKQHIVGRLRRASTAAKDYNFVDGRRPHTHFRIGDQKRDAARFQ
jgi:hypothetical protein